MTLASLNELSPAEASEAFEKCCGAANWVQSMVAARPFASVEEMLTSADDTWLSGNASDWKEAFNHHPKIGDLESLSRKFANTKAWAGGEQAGVQTASSDTLQLLADGNKAYEQKFGYIFIVCATGKSAAEMLDLLQQRIGNDEETELKIAAGEQQKITRLRLQKLLS